MTHLTPRIRHAAAAVCALIVCSGTIGIADQAHLPPPAAPELGQVPMLLPPADADGVVYLPDSSGKRRATTIDPDLQTQLTAYIGDMGSPIAAVVVVEVKTGNLLAMAQGRAPEEWGGRTHTALHTGFPAASLFKSVVTAAAFEVADLDPTAQEGLLGGCSNVRPTGDWLRETEATRRSQMSLRRAFGASCNGYFAKIAVNDLGLGPITAFARRLGWEFGVPTDFVIGKSPFFPPTPENSSTHQVGRFAAGFGNVGISAVHAAWLMLVTANEGRGKPIHLFRDTAATSSPHADPTIYSADTARQMLRVMEATVHGGTGQSTFARGKYRKLRDWVGGKTGTLTGRSPLGLTTLFAGVAPLDQPEIAVASIVVLERRWRIKATSLAAEAFYDYFDSKRPRASFDTAHVRPLRPSKASTAAE